MTVALPPSELMLYGTKDDPLAGIDATVWAAIFTEKYVAELKEKQKYAGIFDAKQNSDAVALWILNPESL